MRIIELKDIKLSQKHQKNPLFTDANNRAKRHQIKSRMRIIELKDIKLSQKHQCE
jgi:hypothetical protein